MKLSNLPLCPMRVSFSTSASYRNIEHPLFTVSGQLPSVGGDDDAKDPEQAAEEEKMRQDAIKRAEREREKKHKQMKEEREKMREDIRGRVSKMHQAHVSPHVVVRITTGSCFSIKLKNQRNRRRRMTMMMTTS